MITNDKRVKLNFSHCHFEMGFQLESTNGLTEIMANKFKSNGQIDLSNSSLSKLSFAEFEFVNDCKEKEFILDNSKIIIDSIFNKSYLGDASAVSTTFMSHCKFDNAKFDTATFYNAVFEKDLYFNKAEFGKHAFFNGSKFAGNVIAVNCNENSPDCMNDFSGSEFSDKVFFNFSRFRSATFKNCSFRNVASFKDTDFRQVDFERCFVEKGADFSNTSYEEGDRESYRIIRSELLKVNNKFESLHYHAKELSVYEKQLTFKDNFGEKFMLSLNRISSNHGLNWTRDLVFTIAISIFFFAVYLLILPKRPFSLGWVSWSSYLTATNLTVEYF